MSVANWVAITRIEGIWVDSTIATDNTGEDALMYSDRLGVPTSSRYKVRLMWSADGKQWHNCTGAKFSNVNWSHSIGGGIAHNPQNGLWVAVGYAQRDAQRDPGSANDTPIIWSNNGKHWMNADTDGFANYIDSGGQHQMGYGNAVAYDPRNGVWVATGGSESPTAGKRTTSALLWSRNGKKWYSATSGDWLYKNLTVGEGVVYDISNQLWVTVCRNSAENTNPNNPNNGLHTTKWSRNGKDWVTAQSSTPVASQPGSGHNYHHIAVDIRTGTWVATGDGRAFPGDGSGLYPGHYNPNGPSILWSKNGKSSWQKATGVFNRLATGVAHDARNGIWVAVGLSNPEGENTLEPGLVHGQEICIKWSTDGKRWHNSLSGGFLKIYFNAAHILTGNVAYDYKNQLWVVCYNGGYPEEYGKVTLEGSADQDGLVGDGSTKEFDLIENSNFPPAQVKSFVYRDNSGNIALQYDPSTVEISVGGVRRHKDYFNGVTRNGWTVSNKGPGTLIFDTAPAAGEVIKAHARLATTIFKWSKDGKHWHDSMYSPYLGSGIAVCSRYGIPPPPAHRQSMGLL